MLTTGIVAQPAPQSTFDALGLILSGGPVSHIDVAAAYVTMGGARDLIPLMRHTLGGRWSAVLKRWLTSFDYCRSEPLALQMLLDIPNSRVRVHDAHRVIRQKCLPAVPFHPKIYLFRGKNRAAVLAGSGNLSRSGLKTGFEAGLFFEVTAPVVSHEKFVMQNISKVRRWYSAAWSEAPDLTDALLLTYSRFYESVEKLRQPTPTDDDVAATGLGGNSLTPEDLIKLRTCTHFWIEAGNVTKNLGPSRPGNQLMMKRLSRVFFGVPAANVPQNSPLTKIKVVYGGTSKDDCSLTFSDNGMDKLTLPLPGAGGPPKYDNQNILFTRIGSGVFDLQLGASVQKAKWLKNSDAIGASHKMPPHGRRWGVF